MKNKTSWTHKILYNDNILKIISLLVAILFWFVIVINVDTSYKRTIYGVAVSVDENASTLTSLGLHVVDMSQKSISVEVSGARNLIGSLTAKDIIITPDISKVSKSGEYEVNLTATLKGPDNRIKIEKINQSKITIKFDTMVTRTLPVEIDVSGGDIPDGYLMQKSIASPSSVTFSGPTAELANVTKAVAKVDVMNGLTKTFTDKCDIVLLDSKNVEISSDNIQKSNDTVDVTIPILKTKTVPLKVDFDNIPTGVDTSKISYKIDPENLTIAGNEEDIDKIEEISLGEVDFKTLEVKSNLTLDVEVPDGIVNVENISVADVEVTLADTDTKTVNVTTFSIINQADGVTVQNKTKVINDVVLYGPSDSIADVEDVTAVIDMSNVQHGSGQHEVEVTFIVPDKVGFWTTGVYNAVVYVKS